MTHPRVDLVDERSLLAAARAGDERAFGRLVERHREGLEQFCLLMLGDRRQAKCVLEESVLCAWREREVVEPIATGRLWLYRFVAHGCLEDLDARR